MQYYYHIGLPQVNSLWSLLYYITPILWPFNICITTKIFIEMTEHLHIINNTEALWRFRKALTNGSTAFIWKLYCHCPKACNIMIRLKLMKLRSNHWIVFPHAITITANREGNTYVTSLIGWDHFNVTRDNIWKSGLKTAIAMTV